MMNPELLTLRSMTAGLLFQPRNMHPVEINRLYATITERYPYQSLQHLPDGARMANPDGEFIVQQTRIQFNEPVMHFQSSKEKCMDLFRVTQNQLQIPQFVTFGVKLTAFVPMNEAPRAAQFIEEKMLTGVKDKLSILGDGRQGVGLRVVLHRDGIYELKIEPFFGDLSQLFIELDIQHPSAFADLSEVESKIDSAYGYLFGEVRDFLMSAE